MKKALLIFVLFFCFNTEAQADEALEKATLKKIFAGKTNLIKALLDSTFLKQVPEKRLLLILKSYKDKLGRYQLASKTKQQHKYRLHFEKGQVLSSIVLNNKNLVVGFWLGAIEPRNDSLSKALKDAKLLDGQVSIRLTKNNEEVIIDYRSDKKMATASSFKLFVLKTLVDKIKNEELGWAQTLKIKDKFKSLPTGISQNWPEGSDVTVRTLANLMISISDNTATDHLIHFLGREDVEKTAPAPVKPLLTTQELFKLKWGVKQELRDEFIKGDLEKRKEILKNLEKLEIKMVRFKNSPVNIREIEWFFSTEELCEVIYALKDSSVLKINAGLAMKDDWYLALFKGGSEPGVLQYTHLLQLKKDADIYCLSATINHRKNINESAFREVIMRMLSLIKQGKVKKVR